MKKNNNQTISTLMVSLVMTLAVLLVPQANAATELYFIHNDHLGTPQVVTDKNQSVVWEGRQKPFGEVEVTINTLDNDARFPGQYLDKESGLRYNYFRDYDPSIARYIQSDPIGLGGGINTYIYGLNNPIRYTDPTGRAVPAVVAACASSVACAAAVAGAAAAAGKGLSELAQIISGALSEDFPRPGVIPGTTEHRGELNTPISTPASPNPSESCVEQAEARYEQCAAGCKTGDELSKCKIDLLLDILACQEKADDIPDFSGSDGDGPFFDGPSDIPGL